MSVIRINHCPVCFAVTRKSARFCSARLPNGRLCGHDFKPNREQLEPVSNDVPLPRWCQPQPARTARYLLDNLDAAAAREITRMLVPSNRRRAARERAAQ